MGASSNGRGSASSVRPLAQGQRGSRQSCNGDGTANDRRTFIQPPAAAVKNTGAKQIAVRLPFEVTEGEIPEQMLERLSRNFTDEEIEQIFLRCGRTLAPSVTAPDVPSVLFVLGPSAVGKSYITDASAAQLFDSVHNAVCSNPT